MSVPFRYNFRSIFYRKTTTALTLLAIALTVCVTTIMVSVQQGFSGSAGRTGSPRNIIAMRAGATSEGESSISLEDAQKIAGLPEVARDADGAPVAVPEVFTGVYLKREGSAGGTNISMRGTAPRALEMRLGGKIDAGRMFQLGKRECIVGRGLVGRIENCRLGGVIRILDEDWPVVGVFSTGGSVYEAEIWADGEVVRQVFERPGWSTVFFTAAPSVDVGAEAKTTAPRQGDYKAILAAMKIDPPTGLIARLKSSEFRLLARSERQYFIDQAGFMGLIIQGLATMLAVMMSFGAVFGCTNTLLASVAGRTREIGSLLAMGFTARAVRLGFLFEALAIGLLGGLIGILLALPVHGMATGTFSFGSFSEATFKFEITPLGVAVSMGLAAFIGVLGGVVPAVRASRLKPVEALRGE
ncbi:MAG TPA: ABC transporter permease [Planctomycetota bacterium]|nr:ABC transporter permease [Planctomycetota bacterium]